MSEAEAGSDWELFQRKTTRPAMITISKWGLISISKGALVDLDLVGAHYVQLYYDRARRRVGFSPCTASDTGAYRLRKRKVGGADVSGKSFLDACAIPYQATRRYEYAVEGDMIVLDLNQYRERCGAE